MSRVSGFNFNFWYLIKTRRLPSRSKRYSLSHFAHFKCMQFSHPHLPCTRTALSLSLSLSFYLCLCRHFSPHTVDANAQMQRFCTKISAFLVGLIERRLNVNAGPWRIKLILRLSLPAKLFPIADFIWLFTLWWSFLQSNVILCN